MTYLWPKKERKKERKREREREKGRKEARKEGRRKKEISVMKKINLTIKAIF